MQSTTSKTAPPLYCFRGYVLVIPLAILMQVVANQPAAFPVAPKLDALHEHAHSRVTIAPLPTPSQASQTVLAIFR